MSALNDKVCPRLNRRLGKAGMKVKMGAPCLVDEDQKSTLMSGSNH